MRQIAGVPDLDGSDAQSLRDGAAVRVGELVGRTREAVEERDELCAEGPERRARERRLAVVDHLLDDASGDFDARASRATAHCDRARQAGRLPCEEGDV